MQSIKSINLWERRVYFRWQCVKKKVLRLSDTTDNHVAKAKCSLVIHRRRKMRKKMNRTHRRWTQGRRRCGVCWQHFPCEQLLISLFFALCCVISESHFSPFFDGLAKTLTILSVVLLFASSTTAAIAVAVDAAAVAVAFDAAFVFQWPL